MTSPIILWMGGERRLADRLIPFLPPSRMLCRRLSAGGAASYFMRPQPAPVEVLNDLNGDLVTLYRLSRTTWRSSSARSNAHLIPNRS